ncbi:MAG: cytidine deaminase [Thermanaeromonas sp.]|nr:cytidine deaminase [Thermanaeromonas sp.]
MRDRLLDLAYEAKGKAYAPYSRFPVGAALLASSGRIYQGCNIENASLGLSVCAERVALWKAVSEGEREFIALAVVGGELAACFPCGACRQVLVEFAPDLEIITGQPGQRLLVCSLKELLPETFTFKEK